MTRAKAYFDAGVDAYDQGKYESALHDFEQAHALSHSPALYFNMAACEEHLEHFQPASLLLRQYLIEKPEADDKAKVEARIHALEARDDEQQKQKAALAAQAAKPEPVVAPPPVVVAPVPAASQSDRPKLKYTWALVGATGLVGAAAIGVGAYTVVHHGDLKSGCGATPAGCSSAQISGLKSTAVATDVLIGVTAAAAVATVIMAVVETRPHHAAQHATAATGTRVAFVGNGVRF
ncbi:MAG TPA: tetratricopeptide repeat protein [Polyangia bacterium]|nr:tetratricopeptide repeat protein [Polyangia bacterium]